MEKKIEHDITVIEGIKQNFPWHICGENIDQQLLRPLQRINQNYASAIALCAQNIKVIHPCPATQKPKNIAIPSLEKSTNFGILNSR